MVPAMVGMLFPENSVVAMALYTFSFVSVLNLKSMLCLLKLCEAYAKSTKFKVCDTKTALCTNLLLDDVSLLLHFPIYYSPVLNMNWSRLFAAGILIKQH